MLYGKTRPHFLHEYHIAGATELTTDRDWKSRVNQITPTVQLFLGLSWESRFSNVAFLGIDAGWETNYYWNQYNLPLAVQTTTGSGWITPVQPGNHALSIEGLTVNVHLDF